ncbi:MAG: hypothetical protein A3C55_04420 [Gammaproteobacteria bacterium RIFCSPHIGHO2_02_FULL_42_13]|nr:MAG: hypothetical protein A3C55_04420 [Gammaproteobacteria bacterium RIFCSPHIGHO2_02_FULL_42_13]
MAKPLRRDSLWAPILLLKQPRFVIQAYHDYACDKQTLVTRIPDKRLAANAPFLAIIEHNCMLIQPTKPL